MRLRIFQELFRIWIRAIELGDTDPSIFKPLGMAKFGRQDYSGAIEALNKAIGDGTEEKALFTARGLSYYKSEQKKMSIPDFQKAVELGTENGEVLLPIS